MTLYRNIEDSLKRIGNSYEIISIYGPRLAGKKTIARNVFYNFNYVSLEDFDNLEIALINPQEFFEINKWPLIINEINRAPSLLEYLRKIVDDRRERGEEKLLMFVLISSNSFKLKHDNSNCLFDREKIVNLYSMSQIELLSVKANVFRPYVDKLIKIELKTKIGYRTKDNMFEQIFNGGMPDLANCFLDRGEFFKKYLDEYINKDIVNIISKANDLKFRYFLSYIALRTSKEVNYEIYSRDLNLNVRTIKRWLTILEDTGIIILLQPFMPNVSKRIIKAPKLYFMDTGLCAYLCKWPNAEMLKDCSMGQAFFETFVVSEIFKSFYNNLENPSRSLYYYRDIDGKEIDLLYIEGNSIYPIEIKKGILPIKSSKNFNVLKKYNMEIKPGLIIDFAYRIEKINDNAYLFPVDILGI